MKFPEDKAKKVESTVRYWNASKEGEQVVGILQSSYEGQFGMCYLINTGDEVVGTPSHKFLQNQLREVPSGSMVRITYQGVGEAKKGQSAPQLYTVEYALVD